MPWMASSKERRPVNIRFKQKGRTCFVTHGDEDIQATQIDLKTGNPWFPGIHYELTKYKLNESPGQMYCCGNFCIKMCPDLITE